MTVTEMLDHVADSRSKSRLYICSCWAVGVVAEIVVLVAFSGEDWARPAAVVLLFALPMLLLMPVIRRMHGLDLRTRTPAWVMRLSRFLSASWWRMLAWGLLTAGLALAIEWGLRQF